MKHFCVSWGRWCQKQVSQAGISNYPHSLLWEVITYHCLRYCFWRQSPHIWLTIERLFIDNLLVTSKQLTPVNQTNLRSKTGEQPCYLFEKRNTTYSCEIIIVWVIRVFVSNTLSTSGKNDYDDGNISDAHSLYHVGLTDAKLYVSAPKPCVNIPPFLVESTCQ